MCDWFEIFDYMYCLVYYIKLVLIGIFEKR